MDDRGKKARTAGPTGPSARSSIAYTTGPTVPVDTTACSATTTADGLRDGRQVSSYAY